MHSCFALSACISILLATATWFYSEELSAYPLSLCFWQKWPLHWLLRKACDPDPITAWHPPDRNNCLGRSEKSQGSKSEPIRANPETAEGNLFSFPHVVYRKERIQELLSCWQPHCHRMGTALLRAQQSRRLHWEMARDRQIPSDTWISSCTSTRWMYAAGLFHNLKP